MTVGILNLCVFRLDFKWKVYKETRSSTVEIFDTTFRPNQNGQMNENQPINKYTYPYKTTRSG